ncbi:MAG: TonB-dependent receptor [Bacteroidetes bacterium]|nr:TonB-dependent receptor [Bacteroidota bacterium]MDA1118990.1 TonB-dependent receptor [Bacteroidota bacterium]
MNILKFKGIVVAVWLLSNLPCNSQIKYTLSGTIVDHLTGEALIGATVYVPELDNGIISNTYGFYSLTLSGNDSIDIVISYIGYESQSKRVYFKKNLVLNLRLSPAVTTLGELVIEGQLNEENVERAQMGVINVPVSKVQELPVVLGETDVLKIIQLLPGVQSGNEGTTGFYVRGGNADQNLVQLDEATVYNPNHLYGLFSTFNAEALNNIQLIKGGFPANYGGRLSSILDITMKEGNNQQFKGSGSMGLVTSKLALEGPIKKDVASFIVSGRRTYIDKIVKPFLPIGNYSDYYFYDTNAKVNWKISSRDRIFLSFFKGRDDAKYDETKGISYDVNFGNTTATLRWNHVFGQKLFLNTSFIHNRYDQDIKAVEDNFYSQVFSGIKDWNAKYEFQYFPGINHFIKFGGGYTNHRITSRGKTEAVITSDQGLDITNIPTKQVNEFAFFVNDEFQITKALSLNLGIRMPGFTSSEATYYKVEPRSTIRIGLSPTSSLKASHTIMNQFLHLVPSSTASVPTDIWLPSTNRTKPQWSEQIALGYFRNFDENKYEASIEIYHKTMKKQVLFPEGNQLIENLDVDTALVYGKGWSNGLEFFLKKNAGRLTGWISYTLSKTEQKFNDLNFGKKFPFQYDRRHLFSAVAVYEVNDRWTLSSVFRYSTGQVKTLPVGRLNVNYGGSLYEGNYYIYGGRNNNRLNSYHRLDFSAIYKRRRRIFGKYYDAELVIGVYNVYNRKNPYFVYFKIDPVTDIAKARQVSLLPIIPSISYNVKF